MALSWAARRRAYYVVIPLLPALLVAGFLVFKASTATSCEDEKINQGELGIDCEGPCSAVCPNRVKPLSVEWAQALRVAPGRYNVAAKVLNENDDLAVGGATYTFTLYDEAGMSIASVDGETPIPLQESFLLFEGPVITNAALPARVTLEFEPELDWKIVESPSQTVVVGEQELTELDTTPRLEALVSNTSASDIRSLPVTAVLYGEDLNAIAVSQTIISELKRNSSEPVVFTWPEPFDIKPGVCALPVSVLLAIDRSGSMNDDGGEPPQPITAVKEAARSFLDSLSNADKAGLVTFATEARLPLDSSLTETVSLVRNAINNVEITQADEEGFTNVGSAIVASHEELREDVGGNKPILILLTDGLSNYPEPDPEEFALLAAQAAKTDGIEFFTIGLGTAVNDGFLQTIASGPDNYFKAAGTTQLTSIYERIATTLCEKEPYLVDIIPLVPHAEVQ